MTPARVMPVSTTGLGVAEWPVWTTTARLVVTEESALVEATAVVFEQLARVDAAANRFLAGSEVSRLARGTGAPAVVSPLLAELIGHGVNPVTGDYSRGAAGFLVRNGEIGAAVQEITPGWLARWFIRSYIEPSPRTKQAAAPKKIVPAKRVELSVLDRFLRSNQAARELIHRAAACDVNRIRFRNPFIPVLRFTAGTGLQIIPAHERRHLLQAEAVKRSTAFPGQP